MYARNIVTLPTHDHLLTDHKALAEVRAGIEAGDVYVLKNAIAPSKILRLRKYLSQVGTHSLPAFQAIRVGCPNFHRINNWDPRSYVKGGFHQFSFFTWNQDPIEMFKLFKNVYGVKNLLTGAPVESFLSELPEHGCSARLSFHFYPAGVGGLHKHSDPVGAHQLTETVVVMSRKGQDFRKGGGFCERADGSRIMVEEYADYGDVITWHCQVPHGVEKVDPEETPDWLAFEGRWICVAAVNSVTADSGVTNAADLGSSDEKTSARALS